MITKNRLIRKMIDETQKEGICKYCGESDKLKMHIYNKKLNLFCKNLCEDCYQTKVLGKIKLIVTKDQNNNIVNLRFIK